MRRRYVVLVLLVFLSVITYLDRVCIAVAGPRMQAELGISPERWGWVLGAFVLGYGAFEIPTGALGDRLGQRWVLTRIVLWWSAFTAFTGVVSNYFALVATRFLFGAGEAGAYPNASGSIGRWFPAAERARAQGFVWAASRVGGALSPLLVVPIMAALGWRAAFFIFGAAGVVWALIWCGWYRDHPSQQPDITPQELVEIAVENRPSSHIQVPWSKLFRSRQLWLIMAMYWCYVWGSMFYLTWFPVYLVKGRGLTEEEMGVYSSLPFVMGAAGNLVGGFLSDRLSRTHGPLIGRRLLGSVCLAVSGLLLLATALTTGKTSGVVLLALGFGVMDCMLPSAWAICLDVGQQYAGAVTGAMNTAGQAGGFVCSVLFGYLVKAYGSYHAPLFVISALVLPSAVLFSLIDPTKQLVRANEAPVAGAETACV
ncbi:MAG: MFS transporter [Acidobacteria bacterium]|nr:MFS transporter [Acidobacteriota bacterium]MCI0723304.1 MFS transporter [Acidobacteriota bacterium]